MKNDDLQPADELADFGKAKMQSCYFSYRGITISSCLFHIYQSIFQHVPWDGLETEYSQNKDFSILVRIRPALAFVPPANVVQYWEFLKDELPGNPGGEG